MPIDFSPLMQGLQSAGNTLEHSAESKKHAADVKTQLTIEQAKLDAQNQQNQAAQKQQQFENFTKIDGPAMADNLKGYTDAISNGNKDLAAQYEQDLNTQLPDYQQKATQFGITAPPIRLERFRAMGKDAGANFSLISRLMRSDPSLSSSQIDDASRALQVATDPRDRVQTLTVIANATKQLNANRDVSRNVPGVNTTEGLDSLSKAGATITAGSTDQGKLTLGSALPAKNADKQSNEQDKIMTMVGQKLDGARSNDQAAKQAELDLYNINKFEDLVNVYGDPNKLTPEQRSLATGELTKFASGKAPTDSEWNKIDPTSLRGSAAKAWERLTNKPTKANAGAFLQTYLDYTKVGRDNAEKTLTNRYGRIIDTFGAKLSPENKQLLQANYKDRFKKFPSDTQKSGTDTSPQTSASGQAPAPHGQSVQQGGHTYVWNGSQYVAQ